MPITRSNIEGEFAVNLIREKVQKLNKRAHKLGLNGLTMEVTSEDREVKIGYIKAIKTFYTVTIYGEPVHYNGWTFVSRVDMVEGSPVFFSAPDNTENMNEKYSDLDTSRCDHCHHDRRRNSVYILRHEDGHEVVVGSTCIKDFIGNLPEKALWAWKNLEKLNSDFDNLGCGSHYNENCIERLDFFALTSALIRTNGWVAKSAVGFGDNKSSTASDIIYYLNPPSTLYPEPYKVWKRFVDRINITDEDTKIANEVNEWINASKDTATTMNDYMYNIRMMNKPDIVSYKHFGYMASAVALYLKNLDKIRIEKEKMENKSNEHFGETGIRYKNISLKFVSSNTFERQNSYHYYDSCMSYRYTFEDEKGNQFVWWASDMINDLEKNKFYSVDFRIKKHDEYKGRKQTIITRVKFND